MNVVLFDSLSEVRVGGTVLARVLTTGRMKLSMSGVANQTEKRTGRKIAHTIAYSLFNLLLIPGWNPFQRRGKEKGFNVEST